jgi:hypothetical protein
MTLFKTTGLGRYATKTAGYLLVLVLVFGSVFFLIVSAFVGYVITQNQVVTFRYEQQRATEIAEAGLNYYKWYLAHFPGDVTNGTGLPGPYVHQYKDPEGDFIGEFSLEVNTNAYCGSISSIDVSSTAHTYAAPDAVSTVRARYTRPTVAEYSFITNAGVWYGSTGTVIGPLHSNQGLRMDAAHNSTIGSGQTSWSCDSTYGCSPTRTVDGVYTTSGNATPGLFSFPVSPIDFTGITLDLSDMKTRAQNNGGSYLGPSGGHGYAIEFNANGTASVRRVTNTLVYQSYSSAQGWHNTERNVITASTSVGTITINPDCPLIFVEDKVWVKGDISQKVTLAAANLSSGSQTNIVLSGDIEYVSGSEAGLLLIAEDDMDVGLEVPNNMDIQGIFIAQNGRFGRNHYRTSDLPTAQDPYVIRASLDTLGTIVTNTRAGTAWVNTSGTVTSGFQGGDDSFDRDQVDNPPPLTPETSDVYVFEDWRQDG